MGVTYQVGFPESTRHGAALMYEEAFRYMLRAAIRDEGRRVAIIESGMDPRRSIAAVDGDELLGLAGFHHDGGSLTGEITFGSMRREIGLLRALRAAAVFTLLERKPEPGELLMDGIVVRRDARGRGIGTGLLAELEAYCRDHGYDRIRLDVVDTNPGARRLYERLGFTAGKTDRTPYLEPFMGFSASTTMVKHL